MKKLYAVLVAAVLLLTFAVSALSFAGEIIRVEYEGFGRVEVDFVGNVHYKDVQVSVVDEGGVEYATTIRELDEDEMSFAVENIAPGKNYGFTISGVRFGLMGDYESVTGAFSVPGEGEIMIKKLDYDGDDRELEIEFSSRVQYDQVQVSILDAQGRSINADIREKDNDSIELRVERLEHGGVYSVVVGGLLLPGYENSLSVEGTFTAR